MAKTSLVSGTVPTPARIPTKHIPFLLTSNILLATALHAGKATLLELDVPIFWLVMRVLACGALGTIAWEGYAGNMSKRLQSGMSVEWLMLALSCFLLFVQQASLYTALLRLSSIRVILFAQFSSAMVSPSTPSKALSLGFAILLSIYADTSLVLTPPVITRFAPAYAALILHALSSAALEHTHSVIVPTHGAAFIRAATALGASLIALPLYILRSILLNFPTTPTLPLASFLTLPLLAASLLFLTPLAASKFLGSGSSSSYGTSVGATPKQLFLVSFPSTFAVACVLGALAFSRYPTWTDLAIACLIFHGASPRALAPSLAPHSITPRTKLMRAYLRTILSNPESRKIFYFLLLNMFYMLVQMLYGVWTNSLGLISDAIHMAFDCMAIGVGLFASVMATWPPNERFTYGYGRIETLSGFANGIFLILISIFIVFEAIQRLLEPPEMNTSQLLLVSSLGLAVNLFGMFAMGGHHHGGHSHSHGHGHSHSAAETSHSPDTSHGHSHGAAAHKRNDDVGRPHSEAPHGHSHEEEENAHSHGCSSDHDHDEHAGHSHAEDHRGHSHSDKPTKRGLSNHKDHNASHDDLNGRHVPPPLDLPSSPESDSHHSHSPEQSPTHKHSHPSPPPFYPDTPVASSTRQFRGPSIQTQTPGGSTHSHEPSDSPPSHSHSHTTPVKSLISNQLPASPITPSYHFGHDDHFETHHKSHSPSSESDGTPTARAPNLHAPDLHSHDSSSHEGHSHNMRGVFLHVMADTLGSVGVIISTLLIQFYGWTGFDPIASLFIAILIAASVVPLVVDTGKVLCLDVDEHREGSIRSALAEIRDIPGVASFTSPRFWPKDSSSLIGTIHLRLTPTHGHTQDGRVDRAVDRVDELLRRRINGLEELTIQVEESGR